MTIEKVIEHIFYTPYNTNKAILTSMLKQLILSYGGNPDEPGQPDEPGVLPEHIVYDGGVEI